MKDRTRIRLIDIAREAGVSAKTVSRVVNNEPGVAEPLRAAIRQTIDRLGFRPNHAARALKINSSRTIMLITNRIDSLYSAAAIQGALAACRLGGFQLIVEDYQADDLGRILGDLDSNPVDGVLTLPPVSDDTTLLAALKARDIPVCRMSPATPLESASEVACHEFDGAAMIGRHFRSLGHECAAILLGIPLHRAAMLRRDGFEQGWAAAGGNPARIRAIEWSDYGDAFDASDRDGPAVPQSFVDVGAAAARRFLALEDRPTAVFAFNDAIAIGFMWEVRAAGLAIPTDLSVAGFDGGVAASLVRPRLTTIHQPVAAMAAAAVKGLIEPHASAASIFEVTFVPGETTAIPSLPSGITR
ncbi:LacI family transcriptional regulator [Sphingomonadaceae bacterium OTU29MARTA1]|nr:LacI family transcriptional regulator [Sphingomonadaceae bacterium OTU29MARTA1]